MKFWESRLLPLTITLTLLFYLLVNPNTISAHPGNTASDGCHYCRTNCDKWGVAWNQRHCHGGGVPVTFSTPKPIINPTSRPVITAKPTIKPTAKPTMTPTATPTPTIEPTQTPSPAPTLIATPSSTPDIKGLQTESSTPTPSPTPTIKPLTAAQTATSLGVLASAIAFPIWVISKIIKRLKRSKSEE